VSSGQLKFSVELEDWPWLDDGQFLDIDVIVKVPSGREVKKKDDAAGGPGMGRSVPFSLGGNATAFFSRKVPTGLKKS